MATQSIKEAPEGILVYSYATVAGVNHIDYSDDLGENYANSEICVLARNEVESLDLVSEGPIQGLVTGKWSLSGNLNEIGYRTGTFVPYTTPKPNTKFTAAQCSGLAFLRSVYWNDIPVIDDVGNFNFQDVDMSWTWGKPNGEAINELSRFQKASHTISERLLHKVPKTYRILNRYARSAIINIRFPGLSNTDPSNGYIYRKSITYNLYSRPIYNIPGKHEEWKLNKSVRVYGKITNPQGYIKSDRIDFRSDLVGDPRLLGWEIKIDRVTPDTSSALVGSMTFIDNITELQSSVFSYPNSAIIRSQFNATYFASIPKRSFDCELLKVKIPGNYDPILRTYATGGFATTNKAWDGTFKTGVHWTDNPAWCYYDLLTNKRYGLGRYIESDYVDKWSLYEIAQQCDTLVSDGQGGLEPRFACNLILNTREEAYKVLNDMASIFRGMTYYTNGLIYAVADFPKEPRTIFTNANVENGDFNYSSTNKKDRHSIAVVRYNNKDDMYKPAVEYVEDIDQIKRLGIREIDITAFGCTSRSQAIRAGKYLLTSENNETETVSFTAGLEAALLRPGDVFSVADANRKGQRYGGRTISITNINNTGSQVYLDSKIGLDSNVEYVLSVATPSYTYDTSTVTGLNSSDLSGIHRKFIQKFSFSGNKATIDGNYTKVDLSGAFDTTNYYISGYPVWCIEISDKYPSYTGSLYFPDSNYDYFRTVAIKEVDVNKFEILGLQYYNSKFGNIESGLILTSTDDIALKVPDSPYDLSLVLESSETSFGVVNYTWKIDDTNNVTSFRVYIKSGEFDESPVVPDNQYFHEFLGPDATTDSFIPEGTGMWYWKVFSWNDIDNIGCATPAEASILVDAPMVQMADASISSLGVAGQSIMTISEGSSFIDDGLVNVISTGETDPTFIWQAGYREGALQNDDESLKYRLTIRPSYEQSSRIPHPTILLEVTGIERESYTFTLDSNIALSGGPYRSYQVVVEGYNPDGYTSAGNIIGQTESDQWHLYPEGYDICEFYNPRQTGIELSNNIATYESGEGTLTAAKSGSYWSVGHIGANGDLTIQYITGYFNSDIVGGYIYTSAAAFPKREALLGEGAYYGSVQKTRFAFDPVLKYVTHPVGAFNVRGLPFAYVSLSFFDAVDEALLNKGIDISTGLYLSNNAKIYADAAVGTLTVGGTVTLQAFTVSGELTQGQIDEMIGGAQGYEVGQILLPNPSSITGDETDDPLYPQGRTTVIYFSYPSGGGFSATGISGPAKSGGGMGGSAVGSFPFYYTGGAGIPPTPVSVLSFTPNNVVPNYNLTYTNHTNWNITGRLFESTDGIDFSTSYPLTGLGFYDIAWKADYMWYYVQLSGDNIHYVGTTDSNIIEVFM